MSEWPESVEVALDGIAQGGEGVGRWEGRVVFAAGGLPGERVRVTLTEYHNAYAHGVVSEVLEVSRDRVEPRVPGADQIPWQHIAYPAQLRFKRQILADQLAKLAGLNDLPIGETIAAPRAWEYRNSAHLHVDGDTVGYHIAGTRDVRAIDADPLLIPALNEVLGGLQAALQPEDGLTDVVLRASESYGYVVAHLHGPRNLRPLAERWRSFSPRLAGIVLPTAPHLGADHVLEELDGIVFRLRPETFFQVNLAGAAELLRLARAGLAPNTAMTLLDLYCGAGTFALPLARQTNQVIGVEEFAGAVADAEAGAQLNGIANTRFVAERVELALARIDAPVDAILLDPPRRGCHPRALEGILRLAPPRIVYISCHPATLARDLKTLVAGGYRPVDVQPVDLFPQTPHIECVVTLER